MKKNNTIAANVNIITIVIMIAALLCAGMLDEQVARMAVAGVALLLTGSLYVMRAMSSKSDFTELVIAQLSKAGLSCKREEDYFLVKQGDVVMKAKLWNNNVHGLKRVHFMFDFAPSIVDSVLPEGWALLAAECNANYDHTMVKFYGDHFSCMVETSVKNAKEFLDEYRFAFEKINETMQGMQANADRVVSQFPVKKKHVGFVIPEHQ